MTVKVPFAAHLQQAIKRDLLLRQLAAYGVVEDDNGTNAAKLTDRELALLIAVTKIRKGL